MKKPFSKYMHRITINKNSFQLSVHINEDKVFLLDRINRLIIDKPTTKEEDVFQRSVPTQTLDINDVEPEVLLKKRDDAPTHNSTEDDSFESTPKLFEDSSALFYDFSKNYLLSPMRGV